PLGWDIGGRKEVIRSLARKDFAAYVLERYDPSNLVLSIAGHYSRAEVDKLIKKHFAKKHETTATPYLPVVERQRKPSLKVTYKKTDQAHLIVGFRGLPASHPDRYNQSVLATILGGGMSSRLFTNVREKRGLAYYVNAGVSGYHDTGTLASSAGVDLTRIYEAIKVILNEFVLISTKKVGDRELAKAKEYIKGGAALSWEDSRSVAFGYGVDELFEGRVRTQEEVLREIDRVTAEDVQRVAKFLVTNSKLNLAAIGPFKDSAKFEKILKV
ncbi:MAG: pitrilysin family protein, partial [Candidatus Curtissbacteria bacterium]|nr:pitrilysin family protein [Candidatus Curtissbacteria bacterium]